MPKMLPCQHTFCHACLAGLIDPALWSVPCPECRTEHYVPSEGADGFPNNRTIAALLDLAVVPTDDVVGENPWIQCVSCEDWVFAVNLCAQCDATFCASCLRTHDVRSHSLIGRQLNRLRSQCVPRLCEKILRQQNDEYFVSIHVAAVRQQVMRAIDPGIEQRQEHGAAILAELDSFLQAELALLVERREKLEKELADVALYCDTLKDACVVWEDDKLADVSATDAQNFQRISEEYIERLQTLTARLTERRQVKFVSVDSALQDCLLDIGCLHVSVVAADELDGSPANEVISPAAEEPHSPAEEPRSQAVGSPAGQAAVEAAADDGTESTLRPPQCRRPRPRAVSLVSFLFYHAIILLFLF